MEKILAVKDAIYAVAERKPDKNEKFGLAGMRYRCSALTSTYYIAIGRYPCNISRILRILSRILTLPPHIYSVRIQNTFSKIRPVVYIKKEKSKRAVNFAKFFS